MIDVQTRSRKNDRNGGASRRVWKTLRSASSDRMNTGVHTATANANRPASSAPPERAYARRSSNCVAALPT